MLILCAEFPTSQFPRSNHKYLNLDEEKKSVKHLDCGFKCYIHTTSKINLEIISLKHRILELKDI